MRHYAHKIIYLLLSVVLLGACGGGGGGDDGGGGGGSNPPAAPIGDIDGNWEISSTETITSQSPAGYCSGEGGVQPIYTLSISQYGNDLSVKDQYGRKFTGVLDGSQISWSGSYTEDGGTTTITSMNATVDNNCETISGADQWQWTDGAGTCAGTTSFTASRLTGSGCGTPPATPGDLSAMAISESAIDLTWTDNSDNETGFRIYRSLDASSGFSVIDTIGPEATYYSDTRLSAGTIYYYYIQAFNNAGHSENSNTASTRTQGGNARVPDMPQNFRVSAGTHDNITLVWDDVAVETGYRLERSKDAVNYSVIDTLAADTGVYTDNTAVQGNTTYYYRLYAMNGAGDSSPAETNGTTAPDPIQDFALTVNTGGLGSGTVTSMGVTGIDCGSDCTHSYGEGTTVDLSAEPDSGSAFDSWQGCDSSSGTSCTVTMSRDKIVTASFTQAVGSAITLSLPATDSDGSYTLGWSYSGFLASSSWTIEEDADTRFASPTFYTSYDATVPYQKGFSGKADGTYCYRVSGGSPRVTSAPACITVASPQAAVLRITNNARYDIIDLRLNGVQQIPVGYAIPVGQSADFTFSSSGTVSIEMGTGFWESSARNIWFTYSGSTNVRLGQTSYETADAVSLGQLLTNFRGSRDWEGAYYCYSCSYLVHSAKFTFASSGGWTFYDDGVQNGTGTVQLVSWPAYSSIVTFKTCSTCENIQLAYPFGLFNYRNGPPDWPIIEYVAQ